MIIDFHTHIFPPEVRDNREDYIRRDPTFAEMYSDPKAKIATAEDLLESMDLSSVDMSVALTFAWMEDDEGEMVKRHNDYILESAAKSNGRIIPFCMTGSSHEVKRCAAAGARGIGELRPESQGWELDGDVGEFIYMDAKTLGIVPLIHVTENGDGEYPGRQGCTLERFERFTRLHPELPVVGAHLGGGIFAEYERVAPHVYADTAAQPFLYPDDLAGPAIDAVPLERLLFGSDFPLIGQQRQINELKRAIKDPARLDAVLGGNAARLLGISL